MLRVQVLRAISEVSPEAWNALVPEGSPPVLRHEWISAFEASGSASAATGWEPHHFAAFQGARLVAAAPAWRKHHSMGEYVYDFGWANAARQLRVDYYPKLLIGVPLSPITARRFVTAQGEDATVLTRTLAEATIASAKSQGLSTVHIIFPPKEEADALEALGVGLFRRSTMQYHWKNPGYRTYDDFLKRFDSKRRHQLKRERAAAAPQGITLRTLRGPQLGPEHAELAYRFYESTCSRNAWGTIQLNRSFFERVFAAMPESLEMVLAEREGRVIAGAFNLATEKRLFGRYWGSFEDHPFLHFNVCLYQSIDDCIQLGREVFEPGAGGEHKIPRGFEPTLIHSLHLAFDRRFDSALRDACRREAHQVQQAVEQALTLTGMKPW